MGKKKEESGKKKIRIVSGRSDKQIVDQFTRKFRNVIKSNGVAEAARWLLRGSTREIGRRTSAPRTVVLPMKKYWDILDKSSVTTIQSKDLKLVK